MVYIFFIGNRYIIRISLHCNFIYRWKITAFLCRKMSFGSWRKQVFRKIKGGFVTMWCLEFIDLELYDVGLIGIIFVAANQWKFCQNSRSRNEEACAYPIFSYKYSCLIYINFQFISFLPSFLPRRSY